MDLTAGRQSSRAFRAVIPANFRPSLLNKRRGGSNSELARRIRGEECRGVGFRGERGFVREMVKLAGVSDHLDLHASQPFEAPT
jgi:hypothetical protein